MSASASVEQFLRAIWGEGPGVAELTAIGKNGVKSFPFKYPDSLPSLIQAIPSHNQESNVYMGVCLRRAPWPRKTGRLDSKGKEVVEYRGTEENTLSSNLAAWFEIDFSGVGHKSGKTISEEQAKKALKEFPLKPSIILKSGGGIQGYFLSKEPIQGDDLWRLKAINKALANYLGADPQSVDLARILRVPGTKNVKYTPPRDCVISFWHPENLYTLDDFDFLPVGDSERPLFANLGAPAPSGQVSEPPKAPAASGSPPGQSPAIPVTNPQPRLLPSIELNEDQIAKIGDLFAEFWIEGSRHKMAMCVGGLLVNRLVALESARRIIIRAAAGANPPADTEKRFKDVKDTYEAWLRGKNVIGATELSDVIIATEIPLGLRKKAQENLDKIIKTLPKVRPPGKGGGGGGGEDDAQEPDFKIVALENFDSRPARWRVTLELANGSHMAATAETNDCKNYDKFQSAFWEQTHILLVNIKRNVWMDMLRSYGEPIKRETPKESRPEGAIESALHEFLGEAKEDADLGMLKAYAGFDDASQFFRFSAFDNFMKNNNLRFEHRVVYDYLKKSGFENTTKRFGPKPTNVWLKKTIEGGGPNGNGNGNGHPKDPSDGAPKSPVPAAAPAPPAADDTPLFGEAAGPVDRPTSTVSGPVPAPDPVPQPEPDSTVDLDTDWANTSIEDDTGPQEEPGARG